MLIVLILSCWLCPADVNGVNYCERSFWCPRLLLYEEGQDTSERDRSSVWHSKIVATRIHNGHLEKELLTASLVDGERSLCSFAIFMREKQNPWLASWPSWPRPKGNLSSHIEDYKTLLKQSQATALSYNVALRCCDKTKFMILRRQKRGSQKHSTRRSWRLTCPLLRWCEFLLTLPIVWPFHLLSMPLSSWSPFIIIGNSCPAALGLCHVDSHTLVLSVLTKNTVYIQEIG